MDVGSVKEQQLKYYISMQPRPTDTNWFIVRQQNPKMEKEKEGEHAIGLNSWTGTEG